MGTSNLYRNKVTRLFSARMKMISLGAFFLSVITLTHGAALKNDTVMGLTEVKFEGGSAHATKEDVAPYNAATAFILGHEGYWYNLREILPSMVWYEFPVGQQFVPARVSFRTYEVSYGPTMWQFVGSNDETCQRFGNWTVLCQDLSGSGYRGNAWTKYCSVDENITTEFRCLGIAVLNNGGDDNAIAILKDIRMWKKEFH